MNGSGAAVAARSIQNWRELAQVIEEDARPVHNGIERLLRDLSWQPGAFFDESIDASQHGTPTCQHDATVHQVSREFR